MVKMVNFNVCVFYHNLKKPQKSRRPTHRILFMMSLQPSPGNKWNLWTQAGGSNLLSGLGVQISSQ